ncbi:DHA2 family efflux MFS transporter permease subunit [Alphaproteobacteria bacterium]|nr:DHA2 family efflux MFS transporter permease subunit [Alphaproteobacteria bacterium]
MSASETETSLSERQRLLIALSTIPAGAMQGMDSFATGVALPQMQGALSATITEVSWILTAYLVAAAMFTPVYAWLARKFGRKRLYIFVICGFLVCSTAVSQATSIQEIVILRFLQGCFAAGLNPLTIQVVLATFPREQQGKAFGWLQTGRMSAVVIGPLVGGVLTEFFGWRVVYLMNIPLGIIALVMMHTLVPTDKPEGSKRFDMFGFIVLGICIAAFQLMLDNGQKLDWFNSPEIVLYTIIAAGTFWVFSIHCFTSRNTYLNPAVFKNRDFIVGSIFGFILNFMMWGYVGLIPPILQSHLGYPPMQAGILMTPRGVGTMIAAFLCGLMLQRINPRPVIFAGMTCVALSCYLLSQLSRETEPFPIMIAILLQGFGLGFMSTAVVTAAFQTIPASLRPDASVILSLFRRMASSIGVSVLFLMLVRSTHAARQSLAENASLYNERLQHTELPDKWSLSHTQGVASLEKVIENEAQFIAYIHDFTVMMFAIIALMPLLLLMRSSAKADEAMKKQDETSDKGENLTKA